MQSENTEESDHWGGSTSEQQEKFNEMNLQVDREQG